MSAKLKSLWAFRFSLRVLFPPLDRVQLGETYAESAYLWTFTSPDVAGRRVGAVLMKRWNRLTKEMRKLGMKCVRTVERGDRGGAYHIHAITPQRWNVIELRPIAERCGFGRIHVKEIPRERMEYVGKYLVKKAPKPVESGMRKWACVGFKGVSAKNIERREKSLTLLDGSRSTLTSKLDWVGADGDTLFTLIMRHDTPPEKLQQETVTMKLSKENETLILQTIASGTICALGEYRSARKRELTFNDDQDHKVTRHLVEHGVEFGGVAIQVSEWLPDGVTEIVKLPAQKGEPVLVEIDGYSRKYGITAKRIVSLASMGGQI